MHGRVILLIVTMLTLIHGGATQQLQLEYSIDEELGSNIVIGDIIRDTVLDSKYTPSDLSRMRFRLFPGKYVRYFSVDTSSGILKTIEVIDREAVCPQAVECKLTVDVAIVMPVEFFQIIKIIIGIIDKNDNAPRFSQQNVEFAVSENALPGMAFIVPNAEDLDSGAFSIQRYELDSQVGNFELQVSNGSVGVDLRLVLTGRLDRESQKSYAMILVAYDGGVPVKSGSLRITVTVLDANDNSPKFDRLLYEVSVVEDAAPLTTIIKVHATDIDEGLNGEIMYSFTSRTKQNLGDTFGIDNTTGEIFLKRQLDYEDETFYQLIVMGKDMGPSSIPVHVKVMVLVEDVNDHPPVISINALSASGQAEIYENVPNGTFVAHVSVEDPDADTNVSCTVHSQYFALTKLYPKEYKIVTMSMFDFEDRDEYSVTVECSDNGTPPLRSTQETSVTILDMNDNAPSFAQSSYVLNLKENGSIGIAVLVPHARDVDSGVNSDIIYSLSGEASSLLVVDPKTGILKTNAIYDYEQMEKFTCDIIATDRGSPPLSAVVTIIVNIVDINDEPPVFSKTLYSFGTFENQPEQTEIGTVFAVDADSSPYDEMYFSLHHIDGDTGAFQIDRFSGKITTTTILDREARTSHGMVVVATNIALPRLSASARVIVYVADRNDNAPIVEFPTQSNQTVQVSQYASIGYTFCKILASDADMGENSRLSYIITQESDDQYPMFALNIHTGDVSVNGNLLSVSEYIHELNIVVRDNGDEPKSTIAALTIIVNQSAAFDSAFYEMSSPIYAANSGPLIRLGYHEKIMVILAVVTAVLVVIVVTAIVLIKRRQARFLATKDTYQYTCHGDVYSDPDRSNVYSDCEPCKTTDASCMEIAPTEDHAENEKDPTTCGEAEKPDHITLKVSCLTFCILLRRVHVLVVKTKDNLGKYLVESSGDQICATTIALWSIP